jgi:hypothetical protein
MPGVAESRKREDTQMSEIAPVFALVAMMVAAVLVVRMAIENGKSKRETQAQLQLHTRLIDKFGSPQELLDYLQSDAGKKFLTPAAAQRTMPYRRILAAAQSGTVLTFVGVACWLVRGSFDQQGMRAMLFLGSVTFALGLGFLCSAVIAHILSRKWGLLNGNGIGTSKVQ